MKIYHKLIVLSISFIFFRPTLGTFFFDDGPNSHFVITRNHEKIFVAIEKGDLKETKQIFEDEKFEIEENAPFIHIAAYFGKKDIVQYFLDQGASANELCLIKYKQPVGFRPDGPFKVRSGLMSLNFFAAQSPGSGVLELLVENGADFEIEGHHESATDIVFKNEDTEALRFLVQKAGTSSPFRLFQSEHKKPHDLMKSLKEENAESVKLYDRTPQLITSNTFAFRKLETLEELVQDKKSSPNRDWGTLFSNILFCQPFFQKKAAAKFALKKKLKDCNGKTVLNLLHSSKDLLLQNRSFVPEILIPIAFSFQTNRQDYRTFCNKLFSEEIEENQEGYQKLLTYLIKTKKMAKRIVLQAEKYKLEQPELEQMKKPAQRFARTLLNGAFISSVLLENNWGISPGPAMEIFRFTDLEEKLLTKPKTPTKCCPIL